MSILRIEIIRKRIIPLRESKNWIQKELSRRVDLNTSVMNRIESGERPIKAEELEKLATVLDTNADFLLGRTNNPNPPIQEEFDSLAEINILLKRYGINQDFLT